MTAGSDLRKIDGRCPSCSAWLQTDNDDLPPAINARAGRCITRECRFYEVLLPLRRPVSVCGVVRDAAAKAGL